MGGLRVDLLLLECVGTLVRTTIEPRCKNLPVWDAGLREVAAAKLKEAGVPDRPVTVVEMARHVGILGPDPDVVIVEAENNSRRPKKRKGRK